MTGVIALRTYHSTHLEGLVGVWNQTFAGGPNFIPLTGEDLQARVIRQPSFDPGCLVAAVEGERVVGFVHFGPMTNFWFTLGERQANRSEGQIWALVAPPSDRALLSLLLDTAIERLSQAGARRVLLSPSWVQCTQPFYNGIAGGYEMPGLSATRSDLLEVAAERGFAPIAHYATPELDLSDRGHLELLRQEATRLRQRHRGVDLQVRWREVTSAFFPPRQVVDLAWGLDTIATTAYGLWPEYARAYRRRLYGITGVQVAKTWRGLGLGKLIMIVALEAARADGAEAAHLHVYRDNQAAWNLYHRALGFQPKYTWMTLARTA